MNIEELVKLRLNEFYEELDKTITFDKNIFPCDDDINVMEVIDIINFVFPDSFFF